MNLELALNNRLSLALLALISGALITLVTQRILGKRGLLTYFVWHSRVGVSADDAIFGSVRATWNGNTIANLYSSALELRNESLKDYDNVVVRVFTNDTVLLTERTEVLGTTRILEWTADFSQQLAIQPSDRPTSIQRNLYGSQREYLIPTLNRGQVVRLTFLNAASSDKQPSIWLDILHKGVKVKYRVAHEEFLGTPRPAAALVGAGLGVLFLAVVIAIVNTVWIAAVLSFLYGLLVVVPGAFSIKLWQRLRELIGG